MAASTSRQPQDIPLPASPATTSTKSKKSLSTAKGKGKGKGKDTDVSRKRRLGKSPTTSSPDDGSDEVWDWVALSDSHVSKVSPIFTKDGSYFFSLAGSSVKIFSSTTGQLVSTLNSPQTHREESSKSLTSLILNPHNTFQIITGSMDGCLRIWDFLDAALLKTYDIGQPILHICAHEKHKDFIFVAVSRRKEDKNRNDNAVVMRISLKASEATASSALQKSSEIVPIGKTRSPTALAFSPSGKWLVATAGHKAYVASLSSIKSGFTKYVSPERLNCLAFHPTEDYFATGDVKGNIRLWYCLNESAGAKVAGIEKKTQTASFHWHAHAVSSLAFTTNGAYLLSGGEESVLVVWQIHTGKKEFVPRTGAPIQTISVAKASDGAEEYLLSLVDGTFVFVSGASLKVSRSYARVKLGPTLSYEASSSSRTMPIAVHPLSSTVILPSSHPSSLQIYSPSSSKILSELEISPSNRVSRRDEQPIEPSRVERIVISPSGEWMASIDARAGDEDIHNEVYLKIWKWDKKSLTWSLNTRIDRPHGTHEVTGLSFSPSLPSGSSVLVSIGRDGNVKTWRLRTEISKGTIKQEYWVTRSSFGFRSEIPCHISWSPDGSLLALTLGSYVAIYDSITNAQLHTFTHPVCKSSTAAFFIGRGRYLGVIGTHDLVLWDVISQSVRWSHQSAFLIDTLVPHPDNGTFALFARSSSHSSQIRVFSTSSPTPLRSVSLPFVLRAFAWYSPRQAPPDPNKSFSIVGISHDCRIMVCGDDIGSTASVHEEEGTTVKGLRSFAPQQKRTLFQDIFGKSIFDEPLPTRSEVPHQLSSGAAEGLMSSVFDGPTHLMPPIENLYDGLMKRYLKRRPEDVKLSVPEQKDQDDDVEMEDASVENAITSSQAPVTMKESKLDMTALVELFKTHSLQSTKSSAPRRGAANGASKVLSARTNGSTSHSSSPAPRTPISAITKPVVPLSTTKTPKSRPSPVVSEVISPSPTLVNGKKRKKATD